MAETLQNLKSVYEKWEGKGANSRQQKSLSTPNGSVEKVLNDGRQRWRNKYGDSIRPPPVRRASKRNYPKMRSVQSVRHMTLSVWGQCHYEHKSESPWYKFHNLGFPSSFEAIGWFSLVCEAVNILCIWYRNESGLLMVSITVIYLCQYVLGAIR